MKHTYLLMVLLAACGSNDGTIYNPPSSNGQGENTNDGGDPTINMPDSPTVCLVTDTYPTTHIQRFFCKSNDNNKDGAGYYWSLWEKFIDCHDTSNLCPSGSVCLNQSYAGRCSSDVAPYCEMNGEKLYCDTVSDSGFFQGWSYEVNGDCTKTDCPIVGGNCLVNIYGYGSVWGTCSK